MKIFIQEQNVKLYQVCLKPVSNQDLDILFGLQTQFPNFEYMGSLNFMSNGVVEGEEGRLSLDQLAPNVILLEKTAATDT